MNRLLSIIVAVILSVNLLSCRSRSEASFIIVSADQHVSASAYPTAVDPARVGAYPADTESGAGYFYDDVLEYRVWMHPEKGAIPVNGGKDYMAAFATYEAAATYSQQNRGAERPLVLVRQREWINEPEPGKYIPEKGERITEWQVEWLKDDKRQPNSIAEFMKHPRPIKVAKDANDQQ